MYLNILCRYIRKDMFVEVGKDYKSPTFNQVLQSLSAKGEYLAFAPDTDDTRMMINLLSLKFPLLKVCINRSFSWISHAFPRSFNVSVYELRFRCLRFSMHIACALVVLWSTINNLWSVWNVITCEIHWFCFCAKISHGNFLPKTSLSFLFQNSWLMVS